MGLITYRCPACGAFDAARHPITRMICMCGKIMTLFDDSDVTDCGDYQLRVMPSWE